MPVACAIAHEALIGCFGAQAGSRTSLMMTFRRHRPAIERVASAKYDASARPQSVMLSSVEVGALLATKSYAMSRSA
jgi:hypothetical protein